MFYPEEICDKLTQFKDEKLKSSEYVKINEDKKVKKQKKSWIRIEYLKD